MHLFFLSEFVNSLNPIQRNPILATSQLERSFKKMTSHSPAQIISFRIEWLYVSFRIEFKAHTKTIRTQNHLRVHSPSCLHSAQTHRHPETLLAPFTQFPPCSLCSSHNGKGQKAPNSGTLIFLFLLLESRLTDIYITCSLTSFRS